MDIFTSFLYGGDSIPNSCVLSSQRIHSTRTHIKRAHRRSTCARKAQYLTPVKSERLKSSLIRVCEGERRATHFIFNLASLYPTFREAKGSRVIAHSKKKNHTTTNARSMAREAVVVRRHAFAQQVIMRFHVIVFVCVSSSFVFKAQKDTVGSRQCANVPIQMSFQKSQIEKKRREDFKRGR